MRHVGEVLRLQAQGFSLRQISRSLGLPRTTVHDYLKRAQQAGIGWPLPEDLDAVGRRGCSRVRRRRRGRGAHSRTGWRSTGS